MAEDPYRLPCVPLWEEGIYRIEISDPALGYDPATGKDGVANVQGLQLGNRTLWLKALLEAGHASDGGHALRNVDFMDSSAIPESCLELDAPTAALMAAIAADSATLPEPCCSRKLLATTPSTCWIAAASTKAACTCCAMRTADGRKW